MTIQISVLLWAVISFLVLMFLLNKFLYKPILAVLDKRHARLEEAARMKSEMDEAAARAASVSGQEGPSEEELAEKARLAERENALRAAAESAAEKHREARLEACRKALAEERPALEKGLWQQLGPLSEAAAEKILS